MLSIIEFADKCGVTPPIIIMWEGMGLISPIGYDAITQMPLYNDEQLLSARKINMFTAIGFSNAEIKKLLSEPLTKEVLISKRAVFENAAKRAAKSLEILDKQIRYAAYEETFQITSFPSFYAYKTRKTFRSLNYLTIEYLDIADKLREYGIKPTPRGHNRLFFTERDFYYENFTIDCMLAVMPESAKNYSAIQLIPGFEKAAYMLFKNDPGYLKEAYEHLLSWINMNGYETDGLAAFVFIEPVFTDRGAEKAWTEMYVPLK